MTTQRNSRRLRAALGAAALAAAGLALPAAPAHAFGDDGGFELEGGTGYVSRPRAVVVVYYPPGTPRLACSVWSPPGPGQWCDATADGGVALYEWR